MIAQIAKTQRKHVIEPGTSAREKKLRVLIPYDGSETAEATLKDLSGATALILGAQCSVEVVRANGSNDRYLNPAA